MKKCVWCNTQVDDNAVFCPNCGHLCDSKNSGVMPMYNADSDELKTQPIQGAAYDPNDETMQKTEALFPDDFNNQNSQQAYTKPLTEDEAQNAYGNYSRYGGATPANGAQMNSQQGYNYQYAQPASTQYNNAYREPDYRNYGDYNNPAGGQGGDIAAAQKPKKNTGLIIIVSVLAVVLAAAIGVLIYTLAQRDDTNSYTDSNLNGSISSDETLPSDESYIDTVDSEFEETVNSGTESIRGLAIYENGGDTHGYGSHGETHSASACVIYPILYAYAHEIDNGAMSSSDQVMIVGNGDGRGGKVKVSGNYASVETLMEIAFRDSNSDAINSLMLHFGMSEIETICKNAGYYSITVEKKIGTEIKGKDNRISADDLAKIVGEMYQSNGYAGRVLAQYTIKSEEVFGMGEIFTGSEIHNFNGWTNYVYNEVIIVEKDGKTYVVACITKTKTDKNNKTTAKNIGGALNKCLK